MKERIASICLTVAIVWFILGWFVIGYAPEWFLIAAGFALAAVVLGERRVRIGGALLVTVSVTTAVIDYRASQEMKERAREIKQKLERIQRRPESSGMSIPLSLSVKRPPRS